MTQSTHNLTSAGGPPQAGERADIARLAEAAFRNLHMDCQCPLPDGRQFTCRMVAWQQGELLATAPVAAGQPVWLQAGQSVICSFKLGQEILRFSATVAARHVLTDANAAEQAHLRLIEIADLKVIQRRRYYRIPLGGKQPSSATCWLVDQREPGLPKVCSKLDGQIVDLSAAGIGVILVDDCRLLEQAQGLQVWVRFVLPGENESLIFRAELRHLAHAADGRRRLGLEFVEYVEPGQHLAVIDRLSRFAAGQAS